MRKHCKCFDNLVAPIYVVSQIIYCIIDDDKLGNSIRYFSFNLFLSKSSRGGPRTVCLGHLDLSCDQSACVKMFFLVATVTTVDHSSLYQFDLSQNIIKKVPVVKDQL